MNENVMSLLDAELEHAGEGTALSPQMLLLEQLRITPEKELKPMGGDGCGKRGGWLPFGFEKGEGGGAACAVV